MEPSLAAAQAEDKFQFEREGYFVADRKDHARQTGVQPGDGAEGLWGMARPQTIQILPPNR